MGKLVRLSGKKVIQKLKRVRFIEISQRGSHVYLISEDGTRVVTIPVHSSKDIPIGTLYNIVVRQAGLSVEEFNGL